MSLSNALHVVKELLWDSTPTGYGDIKTLAPMVAGDSSDDESEDENNGTDWGPPTSVFVGSELGTPSPSSPVSHQSQHAPVPGGPFSALISSMWPQDILGQIQQTEDSGVHPECDYDEFGFRIDRSGDTEDPDPCSYATSEDPSLKLKWVAYIESTQKKFVGDLTWDVVSDCLERTDKLTELIYAGIPHSMRVYLWPRLAGAFRKKREADMSYKKITKKSQCDNTLISSQIEKDLCRTMPSNACFQNMDSIGVKKLQRILQGIAWLYPDIGYCQGMGMIAASLLLFLEEETTFWMMVSIIEDLLPTSYYSVTLIGVQVDQRVLRQLIANYIPSVDEMMKEHDIELSLITLHWFLTAMASVLQHQVLLRAWDIFFYEGSIALFKLTLGMIKYKEKSLLTMENSAQIFNLLSDLPGEISDFSELLKNANKASASLTNVILDTHRKKHFAYLLAEASNQQENNNIPTPIQRRTHLPLKKSWLHLAYEIGSSLYENNMLLCGTSRKKRNHAVTMKAKNVLQTEIVSDLRESILLLARHFNYKGTKADLIPDYSADSHTVDYENYVNIARTKQRRAKALIDFERHEDDELGFRKNDLITIISQKDEHCWIGELNGLRGWFPAKFVEVLDERSKEYASAGDDTVSEAVNDLVRGKLYHALRRVLEHGLKHSTLHGHLHPWMCIEEVSKQTVLKDFQSVYSRLVLCKTYKLDEDGKVLAPEELLYRAVQAINTSHDEIKADMDVKLRSLICYGLNEQALHLWFELICSCHDVLSRWYYPFSYMRSPGWIQIKCELRVLVQFSFNLSINYEIKKAEMNASNMKEDVQDMLVKHHLFSWDI
ncbi:small G protein signaling modulator 3-like isoform X2 [Hydractinia symbiolongicarpus]|uniref:small G protein signaling modulator 3-like isoform X2 n=1 Tax=Hydractinia symbiolongicarpus TaxID=13093 RepID=UPI00254C5C2D|nr:small G protein signaling modulator 3-like isoform X2 [Hydractinia symbiolongicarpus]